MRPVDPVLHSSDVPDRPLPNAPFGFLPSATIPAAIESAKRLSYADGRDAGPAGCFRARRR